MSIGKDSSRNIQGDPGEENREEKNTAGDAGEQEKKEEQDGYRVNRLHKSSVFAALFNDLAFKNDIIDLYNAIYGTDYSHDTELKIVTLHNAVYMGLKNDAAFLIADEVLSLCEHQSTPSRNIPVRFLRYAADEYGAYIGANNLDVYGSKLIPLPTPKFTVLYAGDDRRADEVLKLSDAFKDPKDSCIEVTVRVINIMNPKNRYILDKCPLLREYTELIRAVWRFTKECDSGAEAINRAVDWCIENNILASWLRSHKEGVTDMLITEYNEKRHLETVREEGREEGIKEGREEEATCFGRLAEALDHAGRGSELLEAAKNPGKLRTLYSEFGIQ